MDSLDDSRVAVFEFTDVGRCIFDVFVDLVQHIAQMVRMHRERLLKLNDSFLAGLDEDSGDLIDKVYLVDD